MKLLQKLSTQVITKLSIRLASRFRLESRACFSYNEFNVSRVFPRSFMFHGYSLRSNRRSIFCVVAASLVCYCCAFAFVLPRKYHAIGRVHRQLHIDRILQNRQFRSATYITATQICQPERKTVDSRVTRRVLLCFRSRICNNTLSRITGYLS